MTKLSILSSALAASLLAGCNALGTTDSAACPKGLEQGAHCMSAREVYQGTHTSDHINAQPDHPDKEADDEARVRSAHYDPSSDYHPPVPTTEKPLPIRNPSVVMRIWIAPYEDAQGDLNSGQFAFTEITGRKWTLGEDQIAIVQQKVIRPLSTSTSRGSGLNLMPLNGAQTPAQAQGQGQGQGQATSQTGATPPGVPRQ